MTILPSPASNGPVRVDRRVCGARPRRWRGTRVGVVEREAHPFDGGLEHRHVDQRAPSGDAALQQRRQHTAVGVHAGGDVRDGDPHLRHLLRRAGDRQEPRLALHHEVVGLHRLVRPAVAVAGDVADDQPRVHRLKLVGGQPHPGRGAGREVLHEHVGRRQQPQQHLASPWVLDVEGERLLAAVGPDEVRAQAVDAVVVAAGEVAGVGPLDLDHPGAEVGQLPGRVRRGDRLLERDDGRTTKRLHDDSFDDRHGAHHHRMSCRVRGYRRRPPDQKERS